MSMVTKGDYEASVLLANIWAKAYYVNDAPLATDEEYDLLVQRIKVYESKHPNHIRKDSPTQNIGGISTGFDKAKHIKRMWSMEDIFTEDDLKAWLLKTPSNEYVLEPKFDGASLNLVYDKGWLTMGISRGDGTVGELITNNTINISGIPQSIPYLGKIEIRGEVVMGKTDFENLNKKRLDNGEPLFANPRNAAAGTLRQLDSNVLKERKLTFIPWGIGHSDTEHKSHSDIINFLLSQGFYTYSLPITVETLDDMVRIYNNYIETRSEIPMCLDGMVIKVNDCKEQEAFGYTSKYPKWMVAFKFPAVEKVSKLLAVELQIGRTGVVTPVARIEPVNIDGATVSNVTLHNYSEIKRKDLRIGDQIVVIRSGDVIPKILYPMIDRRNGSEQVVIPATNCPVCNGELFHDTIISKCQNIKCDSRVLNGLKHFVSRNAMNIDGLGIKVLEKLYQLGYVKTLKDIYLLNSDILSNVVSFQAKKIENTLTAINDSRTVQLGKFLFALGIEHIGESAASKIAKHFKDNWMNATYEELLAINGFGEELCSSYLEFVKVNKEELSELIAQLNIFAEIVVIEQSIFRDKNIVLTGSMYKPRDEIKRLFEEYGARVSGSVSKNTDYLIYGKEAGTKLTNAKELGVNCMSIDEALLELTL